MSGHGFALAGGFAGIIATASKEKVRGNVVPGVAIATALMRLRMSGAKLFGAIVTKVGARNQLYGYGYGYGYGYSYGADAPKD